MKIKTSIKAGDPTTTPATTGAPNSGLSTGKRMH